MNFEGCSLVFSILDLHTAAGLVEFDFLAHQVGDASLNKVAYWGNYRLKDHDQGYTRKMAKNMASLDRRVQLSFGGHPKYSGKKPALIFAFLRRFVKASNDNDVSKGKARYLLVNFMTGEAEQRFAQVLPDSAGHIVGRTVGSYPEAVKWLLSNYADADSHEEHTFQQLMAYTQGKHRQAKALRAPMALTPKPLSQDRPGPDKY
eukprot:contig_2925_g599